MPSNKRRYVGRTDHRAEDHLRGSPRGPQVQSHVFAELPMWLTGPQRSDWVDLLAGTTRTHRVWAP